VEIDIPVFLEDTEEVKSRTIEYKLPHYGDAGRMEDIKKTLKVKIPKGVMDGERIRLKGQGGPGYGKGLAGDLYLRIKLVPHPLFDVMGHDLTITIPITPWEAALGCTVKVPTLSGSINLKIAPESQSGQKLRAKGKGLSGKAEQGDLYVLLKVVMPERIDDASKRLWQELAAASDYDPRVELER